MAVKVLLLVISMTFLSDVILLYNYRLSFSPSLSGFKSQSLGSPLKKRTQNTTNKFQLIF